MFASLKYRNVFATLDNGIVPGAQAAGSASGSPMQIAGSAPFRKMVHILEAGSGATSAGVVSLYLMTATNSVASNFASLSQSLQSMSVSSAGKWYLYTDTRVEWFADLGTGATYVKTVVVVAGVTVPLALTTLGYLSGSESAAVFESTTLGRVQELLLY